MNAWYALKCPSGYLGTQWSVKQNCITSPRMVILPGLDAPLYATITTVHGTAAWEREARRAGGVLGVPFTPVAVRFEGAGPRATIVEVGR